MGTNMMSGDNFDASSPGLGRQHKKGMPYARTFTPVRADVALCVLRLIGRVGKALKSWSFGFRLVCTACLVVNDI